MRYPRPLFIRSGIVLSILALLSFATTWNTTAAIGDNDCSAGTRGAPCNIVQGFDQNGAASAVVGATISGGGQPALANRVSGNYGTVGGGVDNQSGNLATVAGGSNNRAGGYRAAIGGGSSNTASSAYATVAGGTNNVASNVHTTVGGGTDNTASELDATVAGGSGNVANYMLATVGGGGYNNASSLDATVAGGSRNIASGAFAAVGGGSDNRASGFDTTVSGGSGNSATGENANIAGGLANRATGKYSGVGGGFENVAGTGQDDEVQYATVGGGSYNRAAGMFATVPGGSANNAGAPYSFAAGRRAVVDPKHSGAILFADSNDMDWRSVAPNEFAVRATGGVRFITSIDASGRSTAGVRLAPGGGSWQVDANGANRTGVAPVDARRILNQLSAMPLATWRDPSQDPSLVHIGASAQDWKFGAGTTGQYIDMMDANGVALAAIQGLNQVVGNQQAQIAALETENATLRAQYSELDTRLHALEKASPPAAAVPQPSLDGWLFTGLALLGMLVAIPKLRR